MGDGERYLRFLRWREKHIKESNFILILSFVVGLLTSCAALILKGIIHFIQSLLTSTFSVNEVNYLYLIYPAIGILLASLFVRFVVKDDISHGVTHILYAISRRQGRLKRHNMWTSIIASSVTIGMGGSVGAEAPIVLTGSAIGSNFGSYFKMNHKTLMLLMGCGAAGAIAGIFKAPIAGLLFTIEVLMLDFTAASVIPLLVASVTAATLSYFVTGTGSIIHFSMIEPFELNRIPWVILLGISCGMVSLYFIRGMNMVEGWYKKMSNSYTKLVVGALVLSMLIFLFPPLYGEGYNTITGLITGNTVTLTEGSLFYAFKDNIWIIVGYVCLIIFFKIAASASTNGAGGVGGVFAPSLFVGCLVGFVVGTVVNETGIAKVSVENIAFSCRNYLYQVPKIHIRGNYLEILFNDILNFH